MDIEVGYLVECTCFCFGFIVNLLEFPSYIPLAFPNYHFQCAILRWNADSVYLELHLHRLDVNAEHELVEFELNWNRWTAALTSFAFGFIENLSI